MEKLSVTVELLQLGEHIEPSGRRIRQHTQNASQQHQKARPPLYHATVTALWWRGKGRGVTGRHLQSRFGPLSSAFGRANLSMHSLGGFY